MEIGFKNHSVPPIFPECSSVLGTGWVRYFIILKASARDTVFFILVYFFIPVKNLKTKEANQPATSNK